jgi:hypothetical protein
MLSEAATSSVIMLPQCSLARLRCRGTIPLNLRALKPFHLSLEHAGVGTCDNEASALVPGLCRSRGRTVRPKACLSNKTALAMISNSWRLPKKVGGGSTATGSCRNHALCKVH